MGTTIGNNGYSRFCYDDLGTLLLFVLYGVGKIYFLLLMVGKVDKKLGFSR